MPFKPEYNPEIDELDDCEISDIPASNYDEEIGWSSARRQSLRPRKSLRQRRLQAGTTITVILIALLILLSSLNINPLGGAIGLIFPGLKPASTPDINIPDSQFYIIGVPSWSQIFVDGSLLTTRPQRVWLDKPLSLSQGNHTFEFVTPPFSSVACVVSIPRQVTDTCYNGHSDIGGADVPRFIVPIFSLNGLPKQQRAALEKTTQQALDTLQYSSTIQPGEHYLANQKIQTATQSLQATIQFQLDTSSQPGSCNDQSCYQDYPSTCYNFCSDSQGIEQAGQILQGWQVDTTVRTRWLYTTASGQIVAENQPDTTRDIEHVQRLYINWKNNGWQVKPDPLQLNSYIQNNSVSFNPACQSARDEIFHQSNQQTGTLRPFNWRFTSGPNLADGCLAVQNYLLHIPKGRSLPHTTILLHRFGIFLAVNPQAHKLLPNIPQASPAEQQVARQLIQNFNP